MDDDKLRELIQKAVGETIEPSRGFEQGFWTKLAARQAPSWAERFGRILDSLLPARPLAPVIGVLFAAFILGGTAGIVTGRQEPSRPVVTLSGSLEVDGVPAHSLAGSILSLEGGVR